MSTSDIILGYLMAFDDNNKHIENNRRTAMLSALTKLIDKDLGQDVSGSLERTVHDRDTLHLLRIVNDMVEAGQGVLDTELDVSMVHNKFSQDTLEELK